jgi:hypothetical protein
MWTAAMVALVLASSALAQEGPDSYLDEGGGAQEGVSGGASGGALGQLPFTGLELTLFAGIGFALLIAGLGLRRAAAKRV